MGRSAGAAIQLMSKENDRALLRLPSGEMRQVPLDCRATDLLWGNGDHGTMAASLCAIEGGPNQNLKHFINMVTGKVTRCALENATSLAGLLLTTEALVTAVKEKKKKGGRGAGDMDDMDDMY